MADDRSSTVMTSDGVEVAVHELGGSGAPVVLAHATGLHGMVWRPVATQVGPELRCVSFDQRGHGDSGAPPALDFDWRGFGLDALAVVGGLGLRRPFGVGHSSGAAGLLLAEEAAPGTFAALYCYEPVVVPADPPLGRDEANWLAAGAR
ncbi:MAG: alpha/beta fold hydrolase [Actinomycetota bacterium]|nr:alpha/beta fold hydrolase [Actinomycetota bacterium]